MRETETPGGRGFRFGRRDEPSTDRGRLCRSVRPCQAMPTVLTDRFLSNQSSNLYHKSTYDLSNAPYFLTGLPVDLPERAVDFRPPLSACRALAGFSRRIFGFDILADIFAFACRALAGWLLRFGFSSIS